MQRLFKNRGSTLCMHASYIEESWNHIFSKRRSAILTPLISSQLKDAAVYVSFAFSFSLRFSGTTRTTPNQTGPLAILTLLKSSFLDTAMLQSDFGEFTGSD